MCRTEDAGFHWSPLVDISLPNPNKGVSGIRLQDGRLLLVFNNSERRRENLSLAQSHDEGNTWDVLYEFEPHQPDNNSEYMKHTYPYIIQVDDGTIHVVYTWKRTQIKHIHFNLSWLEALP